MKISTSHLLVWAGCLSIVTECAAKKTNRNAPQGHFGKLKPHEPGPFDVKLSKAEESKLASGSPVMKQSMPTAEDPDAGGVFCVQDVEAPLSAVWHQILDLDNYTEKVSKLRECKNYYVKKESDGSYKIKTKQVLSALPGYSYESYYDHTYHPESNSLTWVLDYEKTSDFEDVAGHWHVSEHPSKSTCSRVFYACDIQMKGKVPKPVLNYISKQALKQATGWVKKESEAHPEKTIPTAYGGSSEEVVKEPALVGAGVPKRRRGFFGRNKLEPAVQ